MCGAPLYSNRSPWPSAIEKLSTEQVSLFTKKRENFHSFKNKIGIM